MAEPTTHSVDRALEILTLLGETGECGVSEMAARFDVHRSTTSRLLRALERRGLVEQVGDRGRYRLGLTLIRLAAGMIGQLDVTQCGLGPCQALIAAIDETTSVVVPDLDAEVVVLYLPGSAAVATRNWVGQRTPVHATSTGKVLLSELGDEEIGRRLPEVLPALTASTIIDLGRFRQELAEVRSSGYATSQAELEEGLNAVAAPVRDATGRIVAAVSVSGPAYRVPPERLAEIAPILRATGEEISRSLGYAPQAFARRTPNGNDAR